MILWNGSKCLLKNGKDVYHPQKANFQNSEHRHLWDKSKIATTLQIENRSERGRMVPGGFFLYGGFCFWSGMDSVAKRYSIHHARTSANRLEIRCSLKKIFMTASPFKRHPAAVSSGRRLV